MSEPEDNWKKLVTASRPALEKEDASPDSPPTTRIDKLQQSVQSLLLTLTWRRLSLLAALLALTVALIAWFVFAGDEEDPAPSIIDPELPTDFPAP